MAGSVIPSKQLHRAGTIEVLDTYLIDREIGYCTDDHCLYTKVDGVLVKCVESTPLTVTHYVSASGTVALAPNKNNALICTNSPTIAIAIGAGDGAVYHIQITGACTLALTGVTWGGDEITEVATGAEVSILNNVAVGVLYE